MKVIFTRKARQDLVDIARHLVKHNPSRARSYMEELRTACIEIGEMPNAFERLEKTGITEIRRRTFQPYLIFYRLREDEVQLVRVLHGARNYLKILG
ncbi:type II toxin-antitoxin system RelE/ParE family toxin [Neorhizobium alkalisoli]|uniref:type II toxin-antitoxin system RelE/ParE family toxin n=1 Tax=Neorhizobium alkalisoli TaxID=528178 RepID=UPI0011A79A9C|nr:type II toxin-antitoxin system RelE/ParE family toxin [Neorhizobium alkalisoli]